MTRSFPLAIFVPNIGSRSETFIKRQALDLLPGKAVVVGRATFPSNVPIDWKPTGPYFDLQEVRSERMRDKLIRYAGYRVGYRSDMRAVKRFLKRNGVKVILSQYLDWSIQWIDLANDLGITLFAHAHGTDVNSRLLEDRWRLEYLRYNDTGGIITMCEYARQELLKIGLKPEKVRTVHYGIDTASQFERTESSNGFVRCLNVGRMIPCKSPIFALDAFRRALSANSQLHFDYIGSGPYFLAAHQYVQASRLEHAVTLHGGKTNDQVRDFMSKAQIYFQHSVRDPENGQAEGLPVSILEAMSFGLPVVATRLTGIPEEVKDGETGFLVEPGDSSAMADKILALAADEQLRKKMGYAGWIHVQEFFSWEREKKGLLETIGLG